MTERLENTAHPENAGQPENTGHSENRESNGHLSLVSVGPGDLSLVPERARAALRDAEVIVAYDLYLTWVAPLLDPARQVILTPPLTQEKRRAELAIERAAAGQRVALVSSGDIGIYAMAGLVFEDLPEVPAFGVEVIPGITSAAACASLLGSPLTHDFATLSLSDLLCPWAWIEARALHIAAADLACVLYNVQSRGRPDGAHRALRLMLRHKSPETVCGVVRNAYREGQTVTVTTLGELLEMQFDMLTTVVIGNRFTARRGKWMYTPRGYNDWTADAREGDGADAPLPSTPGSVWVYSGTADGNRLALELAGAGADVTLSAASDLGAALAPQHPRLRVHAGRRGVEARRRDLRGAAAVVDATHPYAAQISAQLRGLCAELGLPYLRYGRPSALRGDTPGVLWADDEAGAVRLALEHSSGERPRVFLATGSGGLERYLKAEGAGAAEWFVRLTPQPELLQRAAELGVPPRNICAMVGPFSAAFNEAQWAGWGVTAVICKDSGGEEGQQDARLIAARALGLPLIALRRPPADPASHADPGTVIAAVRQLIPMEETR